MADTQPPAGVTGPVGTVLTLHQSWMNLMIRVGVYGPRLVAYGSGHLDAVDNITKIRTNRLPAA